MRALLRATGSLAPSEQPLDAAALGTVPDHFAWMRSPEAVAAAIATWWAAQRPALSP